MMNTQQSLLAEFEYEMANTRRVLARIPADKKNWTPHEKSMDLGRLTRHVADIPSWMTMTLKTDELDFSKENVPSPDFHSTDELLAQFDANTKTAIHSLKEASEEHFSQPWTMRNGEQIFFTMPKSAVIRTWVMNHNIHHRAQLGVYLRLLNIPVPGLYGPSADDTGM